MKPTCYQKLKFASSLAVAPALIGVAMVSAVAVSAAVVVTLTTMALINRTGGEQ